MSNQKEKQKSLAHNLAHLELPNSDEVGRQHTAAKAIFPGFLPVFANSVAEKHRARR
jgi:hypothetical protein